MDIERKEIYAEAIRFHIEKEGREVARAYLYLLGDDSSVGLFGFLHDFYVDAFAEGEDYGFVIAQEVIKEAKKRGCYKLISTKRHNSGKRMNELYEKLGFKGFGLEFRIDFD